MIIKRLLGMECVVLAGLSVVFFLPHSGKISPAGIAMTLPNWVGAWVGEDAEITAKELDTLAKDTKFSRKTYTGPEGDRIYVSIVLSGDDMTNSIHRPERCLPAQGWSLRSSTERDLPIDAGKTLRTTKLTNSREVETSEKQRFTIENFSYYWFVGYNEMTPSHLTRTLMDLRDRILHGYNQRWAYVTVAANVTSGWARPERSEAETTKIVENFIKELGPTLKNPDGKALL